MAVDKKAIAAMGRKKKAKMPKASTKDLKALEVAGASDDLKQKLFSGTAYGVQDAYDMYMYERERGVSPLEAYRSIWSMSNSESLQG